MNKDIYSEIAKRIPYNQLGNLFRTCKKWYTWAIGSEFWSVRLSWELSCNINFNRYLIVDDTISDFLRYKWTYVRILARIGRKFADSEIFFGPIEMLCSIKPSSYLDNLITRVCFNPSLKRDLRSLSPTQLSEIYRKSTGLQRYKLFKAYPTIDDELIFMIYESGFTIDKKINDIELHDKVKDFKGVAHYIRTGNFISTLQYSSSDVFFLSVAAWKKGDGGLITIFNRGGATDITTDALIYYKIIKGINLYETEKTILTTRFYDNPYLLRTVILYLPQIIEKEIPNNKVINVLSNLRYSNSYNQILLSQNLTLEQYYLIIKAKINVDAIGLSVLISRMIKLFPRKEVNLCLAKLIANYPQLEYLKTPEVPIVPKDTIPYLRIKIFKVLGTKVPVAIYGKNIKKFNQLDKVLQKVIERQIKQKRTKILLKLK